MLSLVVSAIRSRRIQASALLGLTVLAAAAAAAAPWYLRSASTAVAASDVAAAPVSERVYVATRGVSFGQNTGQPLDTVRSQVDPALTVPGVQKSYGERIFGGLSLGTTRVDLTLAARDGVCEHLRVEGRCLGGLGEVVLNRAVAETLGAKVGDELVVHSFRLRNEPKVRVAGLYELRDPQDPYWQNYSPMIRSDVGGPVGDPAFMTVDALHGLRPFTVDVDVHAILPIDAFLPGPGKPDLTKVLAETTAKLHAGNYQTNSQANELARQVRHDLRQVELGVGVAAAQLLVLCWFALFLAVRHTVDERRPDIGLLKLRGAKRSRVWRLTAEQSALPMVAGGVLGWGLGYLVAWALAPAGGTRGGQRELVLSAAAAGFACLGALIVSVVAEWRSLRTPVVGLLRRVPPRRRGWRAGVIDLGVAVLALVGVYQGYAEADSSGEPSVLALLAPVLVALAVGLLVAGVLPWLAGRAGARALRAGQPGVALAALHLARRPGTNRVFALLVVAVAGLGAAGLAYESSTAAWRARAQQDLGAARVLEVRGPTVTGLLSAVRSADPEGRYAMAVTRLLGGRTTDRVVAVDSTRLAAVADWRPEYGTATAGEMARLLRPVAPRPVTIVDGTVTVELSGPAVKMSLHWVTPTGETVAREIGPLAPGQQPYDVTVEKCPPPLGCRLVSFELMGFPTGGTPLTVNVHRVSQSGRELLGAADLGDPARWRPQVGPTGTGLSIGARDGRLELTMYPESMNLPAGQQLDENAYLVDGAVPLPVVIAGRVPPAVPLGDDRMGPLGSWEVPYRVVATSAVLPRVGDSGLFVDIEYAQHATIGKAENAVLEVWLTDRAPSTVVDRLRAAGVTVVADRSTAAESARLGRQGPGSALRFQLFAALVAALLAAGALIVTAAVERRPRAAELGALRAQGIGRRSVRVAGYGGYGVMVLSAVLTGLVAAVLAQVLVSAALPVFSDDWSVLPVPRGPAWLPLALAGGAALLAFGIALTVAARQVVRGANDVRPGVSS